MTPEFLQFKADLLNLFVVAYEGRSSLVSKVADNGHEPDSDPDFDIYLAKGEETRLDTNWVGRYVIVSPSYRISFMEAIEGVQTDYGPSISTNQASDVLVEMIIDYLLDNKIPDIAITKQ
jgi:hypothetical protein